MPAPTASKDIQPIGIMGIQGRNGSDSTFLIPDNQCREAYNIDWFNSSLGRKRGGATNLSLATSGTAFASGTAAMGRFVPADVQTASELWAIDFARNFHRLAGGVTWADPTSVLDACTANPQEVNFLPFNGKLYISYKSAHNRLHVYDPVTGTIRRTGLDLPPVAASVVLAGGAVTDTRKWRIAWTKQVGGVTTYRSNLGPATGSSAMAAQQATVTRGAVPGEGETHWELYAASTSSAFGDYRLQATTVIATTTAVDNATLSSTVAPDDGENTPPPSAKYMVGDDSRVVMAGAWELSTAPENAATPSVRRVWWTAALGAGTGDDERIEITGTINNYADLEEAITGLSSPMQVVTAAATSLERGSFYAYSYESQWKFIATGDVDIPYLKFRVTGGGGTIHHKSIVTAIDINGNPAVYWWSQNGPFRISQGGQEFLGEDLLDIIETVNLDATIPVHTVYHRAKRQIWFYIATGTSLYPNQKVIYDTLLGRVTEDSGVRFGWALHEGESTKAYCSCLFSDTVAASMGRGLKPYIGYSGANEIWKADTTAAADGVGSAVAVGTPFQAYVDTKSYAPWGLNRKGGMKGEATVIANPSEGVTIRLTIYTSEGAESAVSDADLTDKSDAASAEKVFAKFENSKMADSFSFRCRIGDAQATQNTWNLDGLVVPVSYQGQH